MFTCLFVWLSQQKPFEYAQGWDLKCTVRLLQISKYIPTDSTEYNYVNETAMSVII